MRLLLACCGSPAVPLTSVDLIACQVVAQRKHEAWGASCGHFSLWSKFFSGVDRSLSNVAFLS